MRAAQDFGKAPRVNASLRAPLVAARRANPCGPRSVIKRPMSR
jgi:hypothetical protein